MHLSMVLVFLAENAVCRLQKLATEVGCLKWLEEKENTVTH